MSGIDLGGKRILVTGASAGLGVETSRSLAAHGAKVVGAVRDLKKAEGATAQVRKDAAANGGSFELIEPDLAILKSVRAAADKLLAKSEPFDVVVANAGVMATPCGHTADGFEMPSSSKPFHRVPRLPCGPAWSLPPTKSAASTVRIAMLVK